MADKIRWGIISTAGINNALLTPIREAARSELVGVASRNLEKAQAYAKEKDIPKAYGSYEAMLADPNIDVIYNPLPNLMHADWTVQAAEAGKHVLCEKPITTTLADFERVVTAVKANNVVVFEAFMYLHHPQTLKAQEMIREGKLGQIQLINTWFNFYLPKERSENIRLSAELHGGSLWDVGVYPNSMAITMAGDGAPVEVWGNQITGETGVDVAMRGQLRFGNGAIAQISSGFRTPFREGAYIVGDAGILNLVEPWKPGLTGKDSRMLFSPRDGAEETIVTPAIDPYLCEVQAMEACLLDRAEPVVSLSRSRTFLQSALALYESAATGQLVKLE